MGYESLASSSGPMLRGRNSRPKAKASPVLVIHGGAGAMRKEGSSEEQREKYRTALRGALKAGHDVLQAGGEAMDAAVAAVSYMEDCPLFNAAKGAVFNSDGKNELESSIMLSKPPHEYPDIPPSRRGLALTLLTHTRNPSQLARALYLSPSSAPHVLLSGSTAEDIGVALGESKVDPWYYFTRSRWLEHRRGLDLPETPYPPGVPPPDDADHDKELTPLDLMPRGTVGAVALDTRGCIACVTSTGGKTNKLPGRVGDTPQFSAGFYAHEWSPRSWPHKIWRKISHRGKRAVGISGTGDGDYFIRQGTALTIVNRMMYLGESVTKATNFAVTDLAREGGQGGVIALDDRGRVAMPLNCPGMYRGIVRDDGKPLVAIFDDDVLA